MLWQSGKGEQSRETGNSRVGRVCLSEEVQGVGPGLCGRGREQRVGQRGQLMGRPRCRDVLHVLGDGKEIAEDLPWKVAVRAALSAPHLPDCESRILLPRSALPLHWGIDLGI